MFRWVIKFSIVLFIFVSLISIFATYISKESKEQFESGENTPTVPKLSDILDQLDSSVIDTDEDFITQSVEIEDMTKKFLSTLGTYRKKVMMYIKSKKTPTSKKRVHEETIEEVVEETSEDFEEETAEETYETPEETVSQSVIDSSEDTIEGFVSESTFSCESYKMRNRDEAHFENDKRNSGLM